MRLRTILQLVVLLIAASAPAEAQSYDTRVFAGMTLGFGTDSAELISGPSGANLTSRWRLSDGTILNSLPNRDTYSPFRVLARDSSAFGDTFQVFLDTGAGYVSMADSIFSYATGIDSRASVDIVPSFSPGGLNFLRVIVYDSGGVAAPRVDTGEIFHDIVFPVTFAGTAPAANTETKATTVTFSWGASGDTGSGLKHYRLQIDTGPVGAFTAPLFDSQTSTNTTGTVTFPGLDTFYRWRVLAVDFAGNSTATTAETITIDGNGPDTPINLAPATATETRSSVISFAWTAATDTVSGLASMRLQIGRDTIFSATLLVDSVVSNATTGTALVSGPDTFYWRILATDDATNTRASVVTTFFVDTVPPTAASQTSPLTGTETNGTLITFRWTAAVDTHSGLATYRLQIDSGTGSFLQSDLVVDSSGFPGLTETTITTLAGPDTFYWRVIATDDAGNTAVSSSQTFFVDTTPPQGAVLSAPADNTESRSTTITFSWTAGSDTHTGLNRYRLQISRTTAGFILTASETSGGAATYDSATSTNTSGTLTIIGTDTFYWRVVAVDDAGNTAASTTVRAILIDTAGPYNATPVTPASGTETTATTLAFTWTAQSDSSGVASQKIQVARDTLYSAALVLDSAVGIGATSANATLAAGTDTFYWRIVSTDDLGNTSASSDSAFLIDTFAPTPATPVSPSSVETSATSITFRWAPDGDTHSGVNRFRLQIDTGGTYLPGSIRVDTTILTGSQNYETITTLAGTETYFWRVITQDDAGNSSTSSTISFFLDTTAPFNAALIFPLTGGETRLMSVSFAWTVAGDTHSGLSNQRIQIDTSGNFIAGSRTVDSSVGAASTGTTVLVPRQDTYFWRIVAQDDAGNTSATAAQSFFIDSGPPAAAGLLSPSNNDETNALTILFIWSAADDSSTGLNRYHLQIDTAGTFTNLVSDSPTSTNTQGFVTLPRADTYNFRVVSFDDAGNSTASSSRIIIIDTRCSVTLSTPADSAVQDSRPLFQWTGTDADSYTFQIATSSAFTTIIDSSTTPSQSYQPSPPGVDTGDGLDSGSYYWRVIAFDAAGNRDTSIARFIRIDTAIVDTTAPAAFTATGPADGFETGAGPITFSWNLTTDTGTGISQYRIQVDTTGAFTSFFIDSAVNATTNSGTLAIAGTDTRFWRVLARDVAGNTTVTSTRSFLIDSTIPNAVSLLSPAAGHETSASSIAFSWAAASDSHSGVNRYQLQIDTGSALFNQPFVDSSTSANLSGVRSLVGTDSYYWRVLTVDDAGNTVASAIRLLMVDTAGPVDATPISPATGFETNGTNILFNWSAPSDPASGVAQLRLQISTSSAFTSFYADSTLAPADTLGYRTVTGTDTYHWRIVSVDEAGNTRASSDSSFLVDTTAPTAAGLVSPADGFEMRDTQLTFSWLAGSDAHSGVNGYTIQIDTYGTFLNANLLRDSANGTNLAGYVSGIAGLDTFYWRVVTRDDAGNTTASASRSFRIDTVAPTPVSLSTPSDNTETRFNAVTFSWTAATETHTGINRYHLQVDTGTGLFNQPFVDSSVGTNLQAFRVLYGADTYFWRVVVYDDAGNTSASAARTLKVDTAAPTAATQLAPANATETSLGQVSFSWSAGSDTISGVAGYRVQVDTANTFTSLFVDSNAGASLQAVIGGFTRDTYYWRVLTTDDAGNSTATSSRVFLVETAIAVTLAAPNDSAVTDSRPTFTWSGTGADTYTFQIATTSTFATIIDSATTTATFYQPSPPGVDTGDGYDSGTYYWRVIAFDKATNRDTSVARFLRIDTTVVDVTAPAAFAVVGPANGVETRLQTVNFSWNLTTDSGGGVSQYRIQLDTTGAFTSFFIDSAVNATTSSGNVTMNGTGADTYFWRILARDVAGNTTVTLTRTISIDTLPPTAVTLSTPANGTETSTTVVFTWLAGSDTHSGLRRYRLQADTAGTFVTPYFDSATSTNLSGTLVFPTSDTWTWRVMADDDAGNSTGSVTRTIIIDVARPNPATPAAPVDNHETKAVSGVGFSWTAGSDTLSGIFEYRIQIDTTNTFTNLVADSSASTNTTGLVALQANATYYWRIVTVDQVGNTTAATSRFLRTDTVLTVALSSPSDSAVTDSRPTFIWTGSGVDTYVFQIATSAAFTTIVDSITTAATSYQISPPGVDTGDGLDSGSYYWRVIARDNANNQDTSVARNIRIDTTIADTIAPNAFSLSSPPDGTETSVNPHRLFWNLTTDSGGGIAVYRIQVDTTNTFTNPLVDSAVGAGTSDALITFSAGSRTYYWRVVAVDAAGNTTAAPSRSIVIDTNPPTVPAAVSPANFDTSFSISVNFNWSDSSDTGSGLRRYRLQVSLNDTSFAVPVVDLFQFGTSDTTPLYSFITAGTYWWRVIAEDDAGNSSAFSTETAFVRPPSPDTTPPLPVQNFTITSLDTGGFKITWDKSPSADVVQYELYYDSGTGTTNLLLASVAQTTTSYTHVTSAQISGREYRFRIVAADTAGNFDSGTYASGTARSGAIAVATVRIIDPEGGAKLDRSGSAIQIVSQLMGSNAEVAAANTITYQYRRSGITSQWSTMTASNLVTNNANPSNVSTGRDELGNFRFVWNPSLDGVAADTYEIRAFVTDNSANTSGLSVTALGIIFIDTTYTVISGTPTLTETPGQSFHIVGDSILIIEVINAASSETFIITNRADTQTATLFLPIGAFVSATDTARSTLEVSFHPDVPLETTLPSGYVAIGDAFEVVTGNGETMLASGVRAVIRMTFRDDNQDGFVDGTNNRIRVNRVQIARFSVGIGWELLATVSSQAPTATEAGWIEVHSEHFSRFAAVGLGAATNLNAFQVAPNPFRPNDGNPATGSAFTGAAGTGIYFLNLPTNAKLELFTITGVRVFEFATNNSTGQIQWDVKNDDGRDVASGYYIYIVTDLSTGQRVTGKLAIIR